MRYINKNQITEFHVVFETDIQKFSINIYLSTGQAFTFVKDTQSECMALAEKLGLILID